MDLKRFGILLTTAASVLLFGAAGSNASEIRDKFIGALENNDGAGMRAAVEENAAAIPAEIQTLIDEARAPETPAEEKGSKFYIAELIARTYKDITGDMKPLLEVKKRAFDAKLSEQTRPNLTEGVHIVYLPKPSGDVKNVFSPDNIVIKQGETVRWVNSDDIAHIFSTMPVISAGKFSAKSIPPGESWEFKFDKPGEYFYLCFIHQSMVGKITVEGEPQAEPAAATAPAPAAVKEAPAAPAEKEATPAK